MQGPEILWDRALRFGMSVFETVGVHCGRPLFFAEHLTRLQRAAGELLGVEATPFIDAARILPLPDGESGVLRVYVTAGPGGLTGDCTNPNGFALFETMEIFSGPGQGLMLSTDRAPVLPAPGGWKTGNYWSNLRALQSAQREGFDEAVVINTSGEVIGCATGNIFCGLDGRLVTPALSSGARDGVIREWVRNRTGAEETVLAIDDLDRAGEIFVTNSRVGIAMVRRLDGRAVPSTDHARHLAADYREQILQA
jgi:branched-chain amino acid aminotransferase